MALITCPECGKTFSDKASQCPECGCPINYCRNSVVESYDVSQREIDIRSGIETKKIELLDQMIAQAEAFQVTKEDEIHTFSIEDWTFSYGDSDKLFLFLYSTFHNKIDEVLKEYDRAFRIEVTAVNKFDIAKTENIIRTCMRSNGEVDPAPFANQLLCKISDFREEHDIEGFTAASVDFYLEEAFEEASKAIVKTLNETQQIAPSIDVYHKFYAVYLKDNYEYICNTQSLYSIEEYVKNNYENMHLLSIVQRKYSLNGIGDENPFEKYVDFYSRETDTIIEQALDEIRWRERYLNNPDVHNLPKQLIEETGQIILYVIQKINEKFEFGINPTYYDWDNYKKVRAQMNSIKNLDDDNKKKLLLKDCFLKFPFNKDIYVDMFDVYGDQNGETSRLLQMLDADVMALKSAAFQQCVNTNYAKVNWGNVDTINAAYKAISKKKEFLSYFGGELQKQKEITKKYNMYVEWKKRVKEKSQKGLIAVCDLLTDEIDMINKYGSEKVKKALNIGDNVTVYISYDDTVLGTGKRGFAITDKGIYVRQMLQKPVFYSIEQLTGKNHTYKISKSEIMMDDKVLLYYSYDEEIVNKLYIAVRYIVPLLISSDTAPMEEQESQVFCTCCGKKIAAKSNFCKYCGGKNIYKMD